MRDPDRHLDESELAPLVEGKSRPDEATALRSHLIRCRTCLSAYVRALGVRDRWLDDADGFTIPPNLLAQGLAVGDPERARPREPRPSGNRPRRGLKSRRLRGAFAGATAGALAALLMVVALRGPGVPGGSPDGALLPTDSEVVVADVLQDAVREYSRHGFVLPGGRPESTPAPPTYRHGSDHDVAALLAVLRELDGRYIAAPSPELGYWRAAGLLVAGQATTASYALEESRRRYPDDPALLVLEAALAYRESDLDTAARSLRGAAERIPGNPVLRDNLEAVERERSRPRAAADPDRPGS